MGRSTNALLTQALCAMALSACGNELDHDRVEIGSHSQFDSVDGCENSGTGFGYNSANKTLTFALDNSPTILLNAPSGKLYANGYACMSGTTALSTTNVQKIVINAASGQDNKVVIDLAAGPFGSIFSSSGGITAHLEGGNDSLVVRGSKAAERFTLARSKALNGTTSKYDYYAELNGDKSADVKVTYTNSIELSVALGEGADTFSASPAATDITLFQSASIAVLPVDLDVLVFGGAGNDKIRGGAGNDILHGDAGDDTFSMAASADGSDTFFGDEGMDTVDYSGREASVIVDIGPGTAEATGTEDLSVINYANLNGKTLGLKIDGVSAAVTFSGVSSPVDLVSQINAQTASSVAQLGYKPEPRLVLTSPTSTANSLIEVLAGGSSLGILGLSAQVYTTLDADDGLSGEGDDVTQSVENITGSAFADVLIGSSARNVIKAGAGNDVLMGGSSMSFSKASEADALSGEDGDDTIYCPVTNFYAVITGGKGTDWVSFAYRTSGVTAKLDGSATSGGLSENANLNADIENLLGGDGDDILTGGTGNNIIRGGKGNDTLSGAAGDDTLLGELGDDRLNGGAGSQDIVDYSAVSRGITMTLCTDAAHTTGDPLDCQVTAASNNDGESVAGHDYIANCEWIKGSEFADTISAGVSGAIIDGNGGNDTLNGGSGDDHLYGGAGDDALRGAAGYDLLDGNEGNDSLDGGASDGDICLPDGADVVQPVNCEL